MQFFSSPISTSHIIAENSTGQRKPDYHYMSQKYTTREINTHSFIHACILSYLLSTFLCIRYTLSVRPASLAVWPGGGASEGDAVVKMVTGACLLKLVAGHE